MVSHLFKANYKDAELFCIYRPNATYCDLFAFWNNVNANLLMAQGYETLFFHIYIFVIFYNKH